MEFRFGHLVDYATVDVRGKLVLAGIFEVVNVVRGNPIMLGGGVLVAQFRASVMEGTLHTIELRFTNADGGDVGPRQAFPVQFVPESTGPTLFANMMIAIGGNAVPDYGEYTFRFFLNGAQLAEIPIHFVEAGPPVTR